jgi:hypothetical protein
MHILLKFCIRSGVTLALLAILPVAALAQSLPDPDAAQMPPPAPRSSAVVRNLTPAQILAELMRGGYVIYFRHTSTDFSQNDANSKSFDDCANQRNLTDAGRAQARTIGAAIRQLKMPIDKILASPMCRTLETARLALGEPQPDPAMRGAPMPVAASVRYAVLSKIFTTPYPRGANLAIASHGNPFYGVAGPPYLAEGEAAVIRGLGAGDFEIVARIRIDDWPALIKAQ